jgi:hypothetical protein
MAFLLSFIIPSFRLAWRRSLEYHQVTTLLTQARLTFGFTSIQDRLGFHADRFAPLMEKLAVTNG